MVSIASLFSQGTEAYAANRLPATGARATDTDSQKKAADTGADTAVTVGLSPEAQDLLKAQSAQNAVFDAKVSYYKQFRPTYDGFSARNLALGIVDPGAQPFSQNRSPADVAQAARDSMDASYETMRQIGMPFGETGVAGKDVYSLYGELDRRALYTVASNEGGLFTETEQSQARDLMRGQQGMAMGGYWGPTELAGKFVSQTNTEEKFKAGILFMDRASAEEKAGDVEWAHQRAIMQDAYEDIVAGRGGTPDNFDIDHPLVKLIREAIDAWKTNPGMTSSGRVETADDLRIEEWFEGFADRLDRAISETLQQYEADLQRQRTLDNEARLQYEADLQQQQTLDAETARLTV
ncbi:MAG: hypothetical protein RIM72_06870 [Alphaproteobacteria bacterium]